MHHAAETQAPSAQEKLDDTSAVPVSAHVVLCEGVIPPDGSMAAVPLHRIRRNSKIDPRHHRNKAKLASMLDSFRRDGIIQPITIRPIESLEDGTDFEVVAGNTRFDGALEIGLETIPALIRHISANEAVVLAGVENMQRQDLSPVEEGHHAARLLSVHHNDHSEVCKLLDWSESKLKSRVMLTHVTTFVQDALVQGDLKLGHVELLAGVPQEQQDRIAQKIIEEEVSVADAKERLGRGKRQLERACFPLDDCHSCRFNSSTMRDMFSSSADEKKGFCSNATCWDDKTQEALDIIVTDAKDDYGTVLRENEVPLDSYVGLVAEGEEGVGEAQKTACASCQHFGCIVNTTFGSEGKIKGDLCFNLECHAEKVQAYRTAKLAEASITENAAPASGSDTDATESVTPTDTQAGAEGGQDARSSSAPADKAPPQAKAEQPEKVVKALTPATLKRSIKQEALTRFATMGEAAIAGSEPLGAAITLLTLHATFRHEYPEDVVLRAGRILKRLEAEAEVLPPVHAEVGDNKALLLARLEAKKLYDAMNQMASLTVWKRDSAQQMERHPAYQNAARYAQANGIQRDKYLAVTPDYLKAQVKAGVIEDCRRSGFSATYDAKHGEGAFATLAKGKAGDLITAINTFVADDEFSFVGYEPIGFAPDFYFDNI